MVKVLVIGGSGLVGRALFGAWESLGVSTAGTHVAHAFAGSLPLDIRDDGRTRELIGRLKPEIVALPAANPFVDDCELHPQEYRAINVEGTRHAARACAETGSRLIFFSSDYVFDGRRGSSYDEEDVPNPLSEYGRQKLEGERLVLEANARNLVIRTSGVYGWQEVPKNFVLQIVSRLSKGQEARAAVDVFSNPTNADNLAAACVALARAAAKGIYHVAGPERISRFNYARRVAREFGLDESLVKPAAAAEFKQPAARPEFSSLSTAKAGRDVGCELWGVERGLSEMRRSEASWRRRWTDVSPAA